MDTTQENQRPEIIENWIIITFIEVLILALLLPAFFRLGRVPGSVSLALALLLAVAVFAWRTGRQFGYYALVALHSISTLALLAALILFLSITPVLVGIVLLVIGCLAGFVGWKGRRGLAYLLVGVILITGIVVMVSAPDTTRSRGNLWLLSIAAFLFSGGAVRFYFGHSFAELDRPDVLAYFGRTEPPAARHWVASITETPINLLRAGYAALDRVLVGAARPLRRSTGARRQQQKRALSGWRRIGLYIAIVAALLVFPFLVRQFEQATDLSILITMNVGLLFVVLALGLNIVVGFAGLLDLGYAAFFAIGAYTVGVFTWPNLGLEWSFWVVIWLSVLLAAMFGLLIGTPTLRLRGDYLAIVTLAFGEIVPRAIRELWDIRIKIPFIDIYLIGSSTKGFNLTNGPQGMNPVGRPLLFGHEVGVDPLQIGSLVIPPPMQWYFLIAFVGALVLFAASRLEHSRLGRAWMAIREDETAADAMGVDPIRTKLLAFALGASFSGFSGAIYAAMIQAIFPELFSFLVSIFLLIIVIVSGMGNIWGVLAGGLLISLFDRVALAQVVPVYVPGGEVLQRWRWVMYASFLIAIMVLRPEGLFPSAARKAELHAAEEEIDEEEEYERVSETDLLVTDGQTS